MSLSETKCSADLGTGVICEIWPLPWAVIPAKAGIHPQAIENAATTDWIPAFAGMTCVSKGIAFQMTPLPASVPCLLFSTSRPTPFSFLFINIMARRL